MAKRPTSPAAFQVIDHPILRHMLTEARDKRTGHARFRELLGAIGGLMAYEATRDLAVDPLAVNTPLEEFRGVRVRLPLTIVPILRAGLGMAEGMTRYLPDAGTGHIGMFRDETQLNPVGYYEKLPLNVAGGPVLLVDPMLATGGSAMAAVTLLKNRKCKDIRLICLVAAPEGVERVVREHPDLRIFAVSQDRELDDRGYILPGLGDAGDRLFGTSE
ncbi:MAG: uracil phosphoribosyltransferase [Planctomycetes bacterium]|nr:uracil phosphoribosyltransferase [Planctomycetota bacterium]